MFDARAQVAEDQVVAHGSDGMAASPRRGLTRVADAWWRLLLASSALVLVLPLLPWFVARSRSTESWSGLVLIVGGAAAWAWALRRCGPPPTPQLAGAVVVGGAVVAVGAAVDVRLVGALGAAAVVWGAVPLLWPRRQTVFQASSSAAALLSLALLALGLPLAGDIDVIGFPLRQLSAQLAASVLPVLGVPVAFAETVLVTEAGVADVEAPCAGLSTIRLLVATVLVAAIMAPRLRAHLRRAGAAVVAAVVVAVVGNASRVTILSALVLSPDSHARRLDEVARVVHVPLGALVFLVAAAVALWVLLSGAPAATTTTTATTTATTATTAVVMAAIGAVGFAGGATVWRLEQGPRPVAFEGCSGDDERILSSIGPSVPLSEAEAGLYTRHALMASKRALLDDVGAGDSAVGEVLFVKAASLRAIHAPERCLSGAGHRVLGSADRTWRGVTVKRLTLDGDVIGLSFLLSRGDDGAIVSAAGLSDVVAARVGGHRQPWVFVSAVVRASAADDDALMIRLVDAAEEIASPPRPFHPERPATPPTAPTPPLEPLGAP